MRYFSETYRRWRYRTTLSNFPIYTAECKSTQRTGFVSRILCAVFAMEDTSPDKKHYHTRSPTAKGTRHLPTVQWWMRFTGVVMLWFRWIKITFSQIRWGAFMPKTTPHVPQVRLYLFSICKDIVFFLLSLLNCLTAKKMIGDSLILYLGKTL